MVGDHRHLFGEALDMFRLALKIGERNEDRKIGIVVAGRFDPIIKKPLHPFPNAIAPWLDNHATAHARFLGHIGSCDDFLIPCSKIISTAGCKSMANFGHGISSLKFVVSDLSLQNHGVVALRDQRLELVS